MKDGLELPLPGLAAVSFGQPNHLMPPAAAAVRQTNYREVTRSLDRHLPCPVSRAAAFALTSKGPEGLSWTVSFSSTTI